MNCRCDEGFQKVSISTAELSKELEILPSFETENVKTGENGNLTMRLKKRFNTIQSKNFNECFSMLI